MMTTLVGALVLFMAFIVWDLAKKSKAGRFGTMILFLALGLGVLGFIIKTVVIAGMEGI
jgi:ABC-type lipoprotein release transport system permease subunit